MTHINSISNGMGSASMMLLVIAAEGELDTCLSITADTGSELDCLWNNGRRTTAYVYFDEVIKPYAEANGIEAVMIRAQDKHKNDLPPLADKLQRGIHAGVPLFGSRGGRISQGCTAKWKVRAIRQELRRRGAKTAVSYLGLTMDEVERMRISNVKWHQSAWPLIEGRIYRAQAQEELMRRSIPFLLSTECDFCPHKNRSRWERTSKPTIERIADIEKEFDGNLFFTPARIPLKEALKKMDDGQMDIFDGCDGGYCHV